jgi:hypothetical protein
LPARADDVDQRIRALEDELGRLKAEQTQVKEEQMQLKKEAAAAAAALPTFSYRPGEGAWITAADKSWAFRTFYLFNLHMYNGINRRNFKKDEAGAGDLHFRRNRIYWTFCWDDCLYEFRFALDADTGDASNIDVQTTDFRFNFQNLNPWFPTVWLSDKGGESFPYVARSSSSSAQLELASDLLGDGTSMLSHRSIGIGWLDVPVGSGVALLAFEYRPGSGVDKNDISDTDRKQFYMKAGMRPFSSTKNKWLQKLKFGVGFAVDSVDAKGSVASRELSIETFERVAGLTLLDVGGDIGAGRHIRIQPGLEWGVGPYLARIEGGFSSFRGKDKPEASDEFKGLYGHYWRVGHELYLWSPKGLLTGSPTTRGSLLLGGAFARVQAHCGTANNNGACDDVDGVFHRQMVSNSELSLWYFIRPRMRVGINWYWWNIANTDSDSQVAIRCSRKNDTKDGKECSYNTVNLFFQTGW